MLAPQAAALIGPLGALLTGLSIRERVPQIEVAVADNAVALVLRVLAEPQAADLESLAASRAEHRVRLYLQRGGPDSLQRLDAAALEAPLHYRLPAFALQLEFEPTDFIQMSSAVNEALVARAVELLDPDAQAQSARFVLRHRQFHSGVGAGVRSRGRHRGG